MRPQAIPTNQIVDRCDYKKLSDLVLVTFEGWIGLTPESEGKSILIDLRDAVFKRATERLNK